MTSADELKEKGIQLYEQYEYEQAIKVFDQAKEAYREAGQQDMVAEMLSNIGLMHRAIGEGQQALDAMEQALVIFRQQGGSPEAHLRTAQVLGNMGGVYARMDDREQAYNMYRQAADLFEELGEHEKYGQTLLAMGKLQLDEGKFMAGAATYQAALDYVENPTWQQRMIKNLGSTVNRILGGGGAGQQSSNDDDNNRPTN